MAHLLYSPRGSGPYRRVRRMVGRAVRGRAGGCGSGGRASARRRRPAEVSALVGIGGTRHPLRELRPRQGASPLRVVYAFDPLRDVVLLIGGDKGSDARFYERIIPRAERIWKEYLDEQAKGLHEEKP